MPPASPPRTALLAGATGLIGRELLLRLLGDTERCEHLHVWTRRPLADVTPTERLSIELVDFAQLPPAPAPLDDVYIALGTTIKAAGSQAAFRAVDHDMVLATARAALAAGARRLAVVSALGADAKSAVFYNRVKGEMQDAIGRLGFESVVIAQPSLLLGDRAALGQAARSGEVWVTRLMGPLRALVPRALRPIAASSVAAAMVDALSAAKPGLRFLRSAEMQQQERHHQQQALPPNAPQGR